MSSSKDIWNFPHGPSMKDMLVRYYIAQTGANVWFVSAKPEHLEKIANRTAFMVDEDPDLEGLIQSTADRIASFLRIYTPIDGDSDINGALDDISIAAMKIRVTTNEEAA